MSIIKIASLALIITSLNIAYANSASFDCQKSSSQIEKLICSNEYLSELDSALSRVYKASLKKSQSKNEIIKQQKDWLKIRDHKSDVALVKQYEEKILELMNLASYKPTFGKDTIENTLLSLMISKQLSITPEENEARMQTKSYKLGKNELVAFAIYSGNRETEYQFILHKDNKFSLLEVPTFDSESKKIIVNKRLSGIIEFKGSKMEVFSGSGNAGGKIYSYDIDNSKLRLIKQQFITSSKEGKEEKTIEYKK